MEDLLAQVRDHTLLLGEIKTKQENNFVRKFDARVTVFENMAIKISVCQYPSSHLINSHTPIYIDWLIDRLFD